MSETTPHVHSVVAATLIVGGSQSLGVRQKFGIRRRICGGRWQSGSWCSAWQAIPALRKDTGWIVLKWANSWKLVGI